MARIRTQLEAERHRVLLAAARAGVHLSPDRLTARLPQVRITPAERDLIAEYAQERGMGMSEYLRTCALAPPPMERGAD